MLEPRVNLAAIAKEAGVSRMTVSRALRNVRRVNPETRAQILAAAERLGYRPNPLVSAFMTFVRTSKARDEVLAYATSSATRGGWRSLEAYVRFFNGAMERADNRGYRLEEFWLNEKGMTPRRLSEILYARGIRGVVIGPMESPHAHLNLDWKKFSASAIGYSLLKPVLSRATNDQYDSMLLALRELRRIGYRRVGLVMPQADDARVRYRWSAAFLSHHWRYQPDEPAPMHMPATWTDAAALSWIRSSRVEAIVTTQSHFLRYLQEKGIAIPQKLGVVTLDWTKALQPITGVDQETEYVGAAAVDLVVNQLNTNECGIPLHPKMVLLTGTWVAGSTTRRMSNPAKGRKLEKV